MILYGARLVGQGTEEPGWLRIEGGLLREIGTGTPPADGPRVDLGGGWLVPGFVDLHVHGGGGASFQTGNPEEAARAAAFHRRHGTTTMLASLVTAPVADLAAAVHGLADVVADGVLAGVHLEGPFLSEARCGAHEPTLLRDPAPAELGQLLAAGPVTMVTLAPERPGGLDAVRTVVDHGALAALGHTDASYDVVRAGIDAGARVATHLFNGMRPIHHREPGPVVALLEDDRVVVELINDGVHLHPAIVRDVLRTAGADRVALVTDAIGAAGLGDGNYRLGALDVVVRDGVPLLAGGTSIAGSTLTTAAAVRNAAHAGVPLAAAVAAAATTPARVLGLADRGRIEVGLRADLVALDEDFGVRQVWVAGEPVR